MTELASAMMKETADKCRAVLTPKEYPELRKLLDLAACDLESAATIICHNVEAYRTGRPKADWHEDYGPVLWWKLPVEEMPWVGSPGDSDWSDHYTHWTPLPMAPSIPSP